MIHTVEKKRRCGFFLPIFRSSIEKSTNMWIFESWIPICRGGGSLLILLSYSYKNTAFLSEGHGRINGRINMRRRDREENCYENRKKFAGSPG